jgi:glycosyltransferase involved in cell wall biosynthesis
MAERLSGPSVLALVTDLTGPSWWRVLQPFRALQAQSYPCEWEWTTSAVVRPLLRHVDAVMLPRLSWPPEAHAIAAAWIAEHTAAGRLLLYDCDDDLFSFGATERQRAVWRPGVAFDELEAERYERIWALSQADGVTVSTAPLARIVASYTDKPVIVVPNAIDVPWFRGVVRATRRQVPGLTIGWAGGKRADDDVAAMAGAWGRIARRFPSVTFVVQGHLPSAIVAAVPPDRLVVLPWLPLEQYPAGLAEVDIACCSVADDRWNRNKSPIKAMEAAIAGAAVVATPTVYGEIIQHGQHGYLAETADDWESALAALIQRPSVRSMLARRLLRHVERRCSLAENLANWPRAWATIAEDARSRRGRLVTV